MTNIGRGNNFHAYAVFETILAFSFYGRNWWWRRKTSRWWQTHLDELELGRRVAQAWD